MPKTLAWAAALGVFVLVFGVYSFRLGIFPVLMHDDYEYTYPSFSLAERGSLGSPLVGPGLNIENRTYSLIVYYYVAVHSVLIRLFGDGPESIPLANTFHFALLAASVTFFLVQRRLFLGVSVFLYALVSDERLVDAARHGRPEMTAGFCLTMGVLALWLWLGEGRHRPAVLFGMSAALTAGMLSHTSVVFFTLALALVFAVPLWRDAKPRDVVGLLPFLTIPLLYGYFLSTDSVANIRGQLAPAQGDVVLGRLLLLLVRGEWATLASLAAEFLHTHAWKPGLWLGVVVCLALPGLSPSPLSRAARFFAGVYCLLFLMHFLWLKHFVLSYPAVYQATGYIAFAFLAEALALRLGEWFARPALASALRVAAIGLFVCLSAGAMIRFRDRLYGQALPYARLQGALVYALTESGARLGDRVFVPSPFGFHLRHRFDVVAHPAPKYFRGRWSPAFREGLREIWGSETRAQVSAQNLCYAMGLAFIRPTWIVTWDFDYSTMQPFYQFLRRYPDLPGMQLERGSSASLPPPVGGTVRVYRLSLSDAVGALDRSVHTAETPCP